MKRFIQIVFEILIDVVRAVSQFVTSNLRNFANILSALLPYVMYLVGQQICSQNGGQIKVGFELLIPLGFCAVIYFLRSVANKIGKGITVPVPSKRFTEIDEDGEVSVRNSRVQELILYLADLEDWLERKGLL